MLQKDVEEFRGFWCEGDDVVDGDLANLLDQTAREDVSDKIACYRGTSKTKVRTVVGPLTSILPSCRKGSNYPSDGQSNNESVSGRELAFFFFFGSSQGAIVVTRWPCILRLPPQFGRPWYVIVE